MTIDIATFYKFKEITELDVWRGRLLAFGVEHALVGTILLAPEGINATVAGPPSAVSLLHALLVSPENFPGMDWKQTSAEVAPFKRWKVRIKREIVRLGVSGLDPANSTGIAVDPCDWNLLLDDPDLLLIDTRNRYEFALGTFPGAQDPGTEIFSEFIDFAETQLAEQQQRKIAMFCTGGIRCEKASSYLISRGYQNVFQLRGGILNYLQQIPAERSRWQGECVVFDERVAVDGAQRGGRYGWCSGCGAPVAVAHGAVCAECNGNFANRCDMKSSA